MYITHISHVVRFFHNKYTVLVQKIPLRFSDIFPKRLGIFSPNFTRLLVVPVYAGLKIFIQLSPTVTKLRHTGIKRDHPACVSTNDAQFEHIMVVASCR